MLPSVVTVYFHSAWHVRALLLVVVVVVAGVHLPTFCHVPAHATVCMSEGRGQSRYERVSRERTRL